MGDILHNLNKYLFVNLILFFICSICVIGGSVFNFSNQPKFKTIDGELILQRRHAFFVSSLICNILMLLTDIVLLVIYRLKRVRYFYFFIFLIGFSIFLFIFLYTFIGFSEPQKMSELDNENKLYNEKEHECCFKDRFNETCGCTLDDKTQCQVCEEMVGNMPFFVTFCANSIGMVSLFGGVYLSILYYYKKIKQRAEHYDMGVCEYMFSAISSRNTNEVDNEKKGLIDGENDYNKNVIDVAVDGGKDDE